MAITTTPAAVTTTTSPQTPEKNVPTPVVITPKAKRHVFDSIQKSEPAQLKAALCQAVLNMYEFPDEIQKKIIGFQISYQAHANNENIKELTRQCIKEYFENDGFNEFQQLLQKPFNEIDWKSNLLNFLARQLNIGVQQEPLVEAAIQDGKIKWRIVLNDKVLYTRQEGFDFANTNPWRMTWEQFRVFKDSGKRSGTVVISLERFLQCFPREKQEQAKSVWQELKDKNILTAKNRLSDGWRVITNDKIELKHIKDSPIIITKDQVIECLKELAGKRKLKPVIREQFISWWDDKCKYRAGLIWDELIKTDVIGADNQVTTFVVSLSEFLDKLHVSYAEIIDAFSAITSNPNYSERVQFVDANIYRADRSFKGWKGTGRIENTEAGSALRCTKLWDVSVYADLDLHRCTADEMLLNKNNYLDYDHIPSVDSLKAGAQNLLENYQGELKKYKSDLKAIKEATKKEKADVVLRHPSPVTRQQQPENENSVLQKLKRKRSRIKSNIKKLEVKIIQIQAELNSGGHGDIWWTIAIPHKLHVQGATYLQSSAQQKSTVHPFMKDIDAYFTILDQRPEDFHMEGDDYLKALGAFRYMYRCQVRSPKQIAGQYRVGTVPQSFFQKPADKQAIDGFFAEKMYLFLHKREGAETIEDKDTKPSAKIKLEF